MRVGLFSCAKNEGPFLLEWIAYHILSGFTDIVIYSNDSTDGTTELLDALDESGVISHVLQKLDGNQVPQHEAAKTAYDHKAFENAEWLMWLDSDEFLFCSNPENSVVDLIQLIEPTADGMAVNWLNFGDAGHPVWTGEPVTEKFIQRSKEVSSRTSMFKTLFRKSDQIRGFGLHRPFLHAGFREAGGVIVNSNGQPMHDKMYRSGGRKRHSFGAAPADLVAHDWAAIFHYAVKTRDSFELKRKRGQGTKPTEAENRSTRFRNRYWDIFNRNEVHDPRMLDYAARLQTKMTELLSIDAVSKANENCIERYQEKLQQLQAEKISSESSVD